MTTELAAALAAIKKLPGEDIMALAAWLRGQGRASLRERGANDSDIGPMRLDIDKLGDAPLG